MYYIIFFSIDKLAKMSSVYVRAAGGRALLAASAVDGIYKVKNEYQSLAHSNKEIRPWWRVDLGDVHCVWAVNILNRYGSKLISKIGSLK